MVPWAPQTKGKNIFFIMGFFKSYLFDFWKQRVENLKVNILTF